MPNARTSQFASILGWFINVNGLWRHRCRAELSYIYRHHPSMKSFHFWDQFAYRSRLEHRIRWHFVASEQPQKPWTCKLRFFNPFSMENPMLADKRLWRDWKYQITLKDSFDRLGFEQREVSNTNVGMQTTKQRESSEGIIDETSKA